MRFAALLLTCVLSRCFQDVFCRAVFNMYFAALLLDMCFAALFLICVLSHYIMWVKASSSLMFLKPCSASMYLIANVIRNEYYYQVISLFHKKKHYL